MAVVKSNSARRREVRRSVPKPARPWVDWLRRREILWAILWALTFTIVGGLIAVSGQQPRYWVGQFVTKPIVARVDFTAVDEAKTLAERTKAYDREPAVYIANIDFYKDLQGRFEALISRAANTDLDEIPEEDRAVLSIDESVLSSLQQQLDSEGKPTEEWQVRTQQFIRGIFELAILAPQRAEAERSQTSGGVIVIVHPNPADPQQPELSRYPNAIYSISEHVKQLRGSIERLATPFPPSLRETIVAMAMNNLQPTYHYDAAETHQRKQTAFDGVTPRRIPYQTNEVLAAAGTKLNATTRGVILREHEAFEEQLTTAKRWLPYTGQLGFIGVLAIGLWVYIAAYSHRIMQNPMRGLAITALLLSSQALAVGTTQLEGGLVYLTATFPTLLAALVLCIAYDQRFALAIGAILALCVVFSLNLTVGFTIVLLVGVCVGLSQLHDVRSRSKLVKIGLWMGIAMSVAVWLTALAERNLGLVDAFKPIARDSVWVLLAGVLVGLLVQGVLPTIERVFRITTSMTLKELNDASHPLLQRLAQAAPGTYQHSLRLADMAEAAAETIGANGLMCRVGAMYHDIGKIHKPQYFVENQAGGPNRHAKLSPAMSVLIIVGHVKNGIEMAREYGLPLVLRHFIESHHGTTLVEYFYHAAKQKHDSEGQPEPTEFEFRYPGPKPQSKEAAIMMLGDGIESACRTLAEPTPVRLEQLTHAMAQKRLMDGQFDECNLTLQELHKIEESMTKTLCAVYHGRVKYPAEPHDEAAEQQAAPEPQPAAVRTGS
ncbi:MAG: HDIG domain-containing metalloprotein [Phycisphaeraceae bacterium]